MGMPAAPLRERRGNSRARVTSSADRGRARQSRAAQAPETKLGATRSVGLGATTAITVAALLAVLIIVAALATGGRGHQLTLVVARVGNGAARLAEQSNAAWRGLTGPRIAAVHLQGASAVAQGEILRAAAVRPGDDLLSLDLKAVRARVERVGWVNHARVMRLWPDTLVIAVEQRPLLAIWQINGRRMVVTANGGIVTAVRPEDVPKLPLIIGEGAPADAARVLPLVLAHPRLVSRLTAVRRVDGRRWDVLLKDHGVILLPEGGEAQALAHLDRLDQKSGLLNLGLARIDLRTPNFTVVRPGVAATAESPSHGI